MCVLLCFVCVPMTLCVLCVVYCVRACVACGGFRVAVFVCVVWAFVSVWNVLCVVFACYVLGCVDVLCVVRVCVCCLCFV